MPPKLNLRLKKVIQSRRHAMNETKWKKLHFKNQSLHVPSWWSHETLRVGLSRDTGRYVYTVEDIKKGDVVLQETPLTHKTKKGLQKLVNSDPRCMELDGGYKNCIDKNSFDVDEKGYGVFFHGSIFSHSCKPNCILKDGFKFVAKKDIPAGTEVTISYRADISNLYLSRNKKFALSAWFDDCKCESCK